MSQRLILPINQAKLTASMKTAAYRSRFGMTHYGADLISTAGVGTIWASGNGMVVAAGTDSVVGNVVIVRYDNAYNRAENTFQDVIFRYFHLDSYSVKTGDKVTKDTRLGAYGNTGALSTGAHLHLEADIDVSHPLHSPTVSRSSFLKGSSDGAYDGTMSNPLEWLFRKTSAPDNQTYTTDNSSYIREEDKTIPEINEAEETGPREAGTTKLELPGIDVSAHNGTVDWRKVKAAGKTFAFIRLGWCGYDGPIEANGGLDKMFHTNMKNAIAAGMDVGVYVYSYAKTAAAATIAAWEALELVRPYSLTYPIAFDIEDALYTHMTREENTAIAEAFLSVIDRARYYGMLYTYKSFAEGSLNMANLAAYDMWIAQYAFANTYSGAYGIWQHTGEGKCDGVTGACDLNTAYRDYAALIRESGRNQPESDDSIYVLQVLEGSRSEVEAYAGKLRELTVDSKPINPLIRRKN